MKQIFIFLMVMIVLNTRNAYCQYNYGYQTRDIHGNIVNSSDNYQTYNNHGAIVNSSDNYQTRDIHGTIVNSSDTYSTRDANGVIVIHQGNQPNYGNGILRLSK